MTARSTRPETKPTLSRCFADEVHAKLFRARTRRSIFCAFARFCYESFDNRMPRCAQESTSSRVLSWMIRMSPAHARGGRHAGLSARAARF